MPDVRELLPGLPNPSEPEPEGTRFRLFDAAASFLKAGLVDRISSYRAGLLLGGDSRSAVGPLGLERLDFAPRFRLVFIMGFSFGILVWLPLVIGRQSASDSLLAKNFLVLVSVYIWIRFEQKMAIAGLAALVHDLLLTAGVYSLVGFEVTPGTVIGLLTILGFSLYDSVVVFDKVDENTRGLLGGSRYTYGEAANLAVNQTLMRSINTSLIGLLPVAGLLFVGALLLGVGTLKDLALVLFVGMLTGAYSSLFLATPWLVDLKMLDQRYKLHAQRVLAKRAQLTRERDKDEEGRPARAAAKAGARTSRAKADDAGEDSDDVQSRIDALAASSAPRVGAKPTQGAKPPQRKRPGSGGRPGGKRR